MEKRQIGDKMASTKQFRDFILEQLREIENISCKPMMGEFLLYYNGILFGGIYDDRLLLKTTKTNEKYALQKEIPYNGAKPMFMVENLDDVQYLKDIIETTYKGLKANKKA